MQRECSENDSNLNSFSNGIDPSSAAKSHDHLSSLEKVIEFYKFSSKIDLQSIKRQLTESDSNFKEKKKPDYDPNTDYSILLSQQKTAQEVLLKCLGQSIIELEEVEEKYLHQSKSNYELELRVNPKWKKRRKNYQLKKSFKCPFETCRKSYASDPSLQNHLKLKHLAGKKSERFDYSIKVFQALKEGEELPKTELNLYEGFIKVKMRLTVFLENSN
jgi:hypothetical protein